MPFNVISLWWASFISGKIGHQHIGVIYYGLALHAFSSNQKKNSSKHGVASEGIQIENGPSLFKLAVFCLWKNKSESCEIISNMGYARRYWVTIPCQKTETTGASSTQVNHHFRHMHEQQSGYGRMLFWIVSGCDSGSPEKQYLMKCQWHWYFAGLDISVAEVREAS